MNEKTKKALWHAGRLVLMAGLVAYVFSRANFRDRVRPAVGAEARPIVRTTEAGIVVRSEDDREQLVPQADLDARRAIRVPGILTIAERVAGRWGWLLAALGAMMFQSPLGAVRWRILLKVQGIHITLLESLRLTYIGWFFNNWLPGATGGDFVKAWYIARQTRRKTEAVTVVFLDRFIGIISLCLLGGAAVLVSLGDPRLRVPQVLIGAFLAGTVVGTIVFYSRRVRALLRIERLLAKLPLKGMVTKVDRALFLYRDHKGAVGWAVLCGWATQAASVMCALFVGTALGSHALWTHYFVNMPIIWIGWSLVPVPGGFGVAEGLAQQLFGRDVLAAPGQTMAASEAASLALAMMLAYRLVQMAVAVPGAVLYLFRRTDVSPSEMHDRMHDASADPSTLAEGDGDA